RRISLHKLCLALSRVSIFKRSNALASCRDLYGFWLIIKCDQGVFAHMIHAPVCLGSAGRPVVFGSKGHRIFQCGGSLMGVPEMAFGSVALQSEPPCNI